MRTLDTFERAMVRTHSHAPFNVVTVLRLAGGPDRAELERALAALGDRHHVLPARIVDGRFEQTEEATLAPSFVVRRDAEHWREVAEAELNVAIDLERGPSVRCCLIEQPSVGEASSKCEVVLTLPHVIADAASVVHLVDDLLRLCSGEELGEPSVIPQLPSPEDRFPARFRGWSGWIRTASALARESFSELVFRCRVGRRGERPIARNSRCRLFSIRLTRDQTKTVQNRARKARVTVASACTAALLLSLRRHLHDDGDRPMRWFTIAGLRQQLRPPIDSRRLGACWAMLRFCIEIRGEPDLWSLSARVGAITRDGLRRGDRFTAYLFSETLMKMLLATRLMRMANVAVSYSGRAEIGTKYGGIEVDELHGFVSTVDIGPECIAQIRIHDQRLACGMVYLESDMSRETAQAVSQAARDMLVAPKQESKL